MRFFLSFYLFVTLYFMEIPVVFVMVSETAYENIANKAILTFSEKLFEKFLLVTPRNDLY